jgi:cytochrome bd-type quinol oxidase subunit 2
MDLSAFFGIVSTIDFALLGLWWVTVQARPDLRSRQLKTGKAAYLVSLEFVIPGTASLLAQVAPNLQIVWRIAFAALGLIGIVAIAGLSPAMRRAGASGVARVLVWTTAPCYAVIVALAAWPQIVSRLNVQLSALQVEALVFCVAIFLSAQTAWAAAMSPESEAAREEAREELEPVSSTVR